MLPLRLTTSLKVVVLLHGVVNVVDGELLQIGRVSRLHMGVYLCIASNGVPPSISKRVALRVQCKQLHTVLGIKNTLQKVVV